MVDPGLTVSVKIQLEKVLARSPLATSPSLSRFLRFIVEETLAGREEEINEYNLGVRVFNRAPEFNPRTDPIVRVQTHHLRARLTQYYAGEGTTDPLVIELPARKYVPVFRAVAVEAVPEEIAPESAVREETVASIDGGGRGLRRSVVVSTALVVLVASAVLWVRGFERQSVSAAARRHEPDAAAQDLYIRGRYLLDRQTEAALRESIECFRQATARDRQFAAAFAGIADANNMLVQYGYEAPKDGMEAARKAAHHALELDPALAEGYVSLAAITEAYDWNFGEAEKLYRRALELDPHLPAAHLWYGMFLRDQGRLKEAVAQLRRAEEMEPLSILVSINLGYALRQVGDSSGAMEQVQRAEEMNPELPAPDVMLANLYRSRSEYQASDSTLARARSHSDGNPHALAMVACTYARLGRRVEGAGLLHQMEELSKQRYVSPYDLANVAWMLGQEDQAVTWFEEAFRQRSTGVIFLPKDKEYAQSPRMQTLLKRIG